MTEHEVNLIYSIAKTIAPKYVFAYYSKEDLIQEAYIMGMDAYNRWDRKRPLENFIARHISNRLKTLKRNKFYRVGPDGEVTELQKRKRSIIQPTSIDRSIDQTVKISLDDENLDDIIPFIYRRDYLRLLGGARVSSSIKTKIIEICQKKLVD